MAARSRGLRRTFIVSLIAFTTVLSLTFATVATHRVTANLREQLVRRGETLVGDLARESVRIFGLEDPLERELSLMLLTHRLIISDVVFAQIVFDGEVVSESSSSNVEPPDISSDAGSRPSMTQVTDAGGTYLDFTRMLPGNTGYVRLGLSLEAVPREARRTLIVMAGISLLFIGVGSGLAFGLYSAILKPLERVVASIRRLAGGDTRARAAVEGADELRELAFAFNTMADVIVRRNEELQAVNAELRSANRAKAEFLTMIGHELKTPLHSVRGYCQLLLAELEGPLTSGQRADITAVLMAGNHLLSLIDNILSFSASGTEPLHIQPLEFADLVEHAMNQVRPMAQKKDIDLRTAHADAGTIYGDETKLRQVLINLLHNAVKYTDTGWVEVRAQRARNGLSVQVRDTGPGIPPSEQTRIFEPFERVGGGSCSCEDMKGLGLGLAIVRRYVSAHGGSITVDCPPDGGTRFSLFLPNARLPREVTNATVRREPLVS